MQTSYLRCSANAIKKRKVLSTSAMSLIALCGMPYLAHGQEQSEALTSGAVDEILVTAQKREERLQDVPVPVTVLNGDALGDNGQVLLRDYYASIPGFSLAPGNIGHQTLAIRGITAGGFTASTTGVMVDDVPYGSSVSATNEVPDIDPGDLVRIEVLRGPQGTLYGDSSMGGLLKFVTKDPSTESYSGRFEGGSSYVHNGAEPGYSLRASANIPLSNTAAVRVSGFTRQDPGYIDNPELNLKGLNKAHADGARLATIWRPSEKLSLKLNALYQNYKADDTSEVYVEPDLVGLQHNSVPGSGGYKRTVEAYSATLNYELGSVDLTSVTGYNVNRWNVGTDYTSIFGPLTQSVFGVTGTPIFQNSDDTKVTQEIRATGKMGQSVDWLVGGFYTHERQEGGEDTFATEALTGRIVGLDYTFTSPVVFNEYAAFCDLTYRLTDRFEVQVGGRESLLRQPSEPPVNYAGPLGFIFGPQSAIPPADANVFTYLFAPRYKLPSGLMVYARFASGYRPGGPNVGVSGVPLQYKPDKTSNYELGVKGEFLDGALTIDTSIYYIDWSDIQINLHNPLSYNSNGSGAKSEGVELSITSKPLTGLAIAAWISYDDAALTQPFPAASSAYGVSGDKLPYSSRWSGNVSLEQTFPLWGNAIGFAGAMSSYVGEREGLFSASPLRQRYPAYTKTDLRTGVRYDSWTANVYINNLSDARGVLSGGLGYYLPNSFFYVQPRTVGMSLSKAF